MPGCFPYIPLMSSFLSSRTFRVGTITVLRCAQLHTKESLAVVSSDCNPELQGRHCSHRRESGGHFLFCCFFFNIEPGGCHFRQYPCSREIQRFCSLGSAGDGDPEASAFPPQPDWRLGFEPDSAEGFDSNTKHCTSFFLFRCFSTSFCDCNLNPNGSMGSIFSTRILSRRESRRLDRTGVLRVLHVNCSSELVRSEVWM